MNQVFKRAYRAAVVTGIASAATVGIFASTASAAENTWIQDRGQSGAKCITSKPGGGVAREDCRFGDRSQLWDRTGSQIKRAYTNQCLDSNDAGHVYWLECNGGNYQNWDYPNYGGGYVYIQNRQTGKYINLNGSGLTASAAQLSPFRFFGGE